MPDIRKNTNNLLMMQTCKLLRDTKHQLLEEIGLAPGQDIVLLLLADQEGLTQNEIAVRSCVRAASMTNTLQRMEKSRLIVRRSDPDDQRISRVYLTDAGEKKLQEVFVLRQKLERINFEGFSAREQETFWKLIQRMNQNLSRQKAS